MSNSIERVDAPSGATHKTLKGTYMKHAAGAWFEWLHEWVKVDSGVHIRVNQLTEISGDEMNLKKLTQAVFEGLPKEYRWAAVDADGETCAYEVKPDCQADIGRWTRPESRGGLVFFGAGFDGSDFKNSLIERLDVPTKADIDWANAPEGATHYSKRFGDYYKAEDGFLLSYLANESRWVVLIDFSISSLECPHFEMIKRPESIHDVVRSIEAARVEEQFKVEPCPYGCVAATIEQACMPWPDGDPRYFETSDAPETKKYPHYFKDVSDVDAIDLYHVARLYDITDPALFHAFKKIACAGKRGAKDRAQDVQEAIDALKRWRELSV